jgi:guanosine-3',5'-bis(diphosphate) 3'-pyrophosphohydrolase
MKRAGIVRINDIVDYIAAYHPDADFDLIRKAYIFSAQVHHGQTRLSGEPYLNHPLSVAMILAEMNLDEYAVSTGLLHDTVEDTYATIGELDEKFGEEISFLVDGVTKISKLTHKSRIDRQAETFRKMLLAMSKDIRVILIKLADRLHNMRTLEFVSPKRQAAISRETLDIYVPLASRLGIFFIKKELEDLSLRYLNEKVYNEIEEELVVTSDQREKYVKEVVEIINEKLNQFGIKATILGRPKHIHSIYNKMQEQNLDFNQIYDITAFRIIVDERKECYEVLGILHSIWKPVPGRFKDYISLPKRNMYQSLHSIMIGPYGQRIEIQIRTREMDAVAKHGIAAHWKYKEGRKIEQQDDQRFEWLQQIIESQKDMKDYHELIETFRLDLFPDEVYVFTPAGEVIELPKDSTPVDFAYRIHTDVGHKCVGAKVDGNMVNLRYQLKSGDVVEIMTLSNHSPSRDWLKSVKTIRARTKINQWFKQLDREKNIRLGREMCDKGFKKSNLNFAKLIKGSRFFEELKKEGIKSIDDLLEAIGRGTKSYRHILNRFVPKDVQEEPTPEDKIKQVTKKQVKKDPSGIKIDGLDDILVRLAKCCNPIPGDKIKGYITRGRGVTVHTVNCSFVKDIDSSRSIDAKWDDDTKYLAVVTIEVVCEDKKGILADITTAISASEVNILGANVKTSPGSKAVNLFKLEISGLAQLEDIKKEVKKVKGVIGVSRYRS